MKVTPLHEVIIGLKRVRKESTIVEKLQRNDSFALRTLLQGNFDPRVKFNFPVGEPPFEKKNEEVELTRPLLMKLGACMANAKGNNTTKERIFIDFLEAINRRDATLFVLMKDKALSSKYPFLTEDIVRKAFPKLLLDNDSQTVDDSQGQ